MTQVTIPINFTKGRGSATLMAHRFEKATRNASDDGWDSLQDTTTGDSPPLLI